MSLESGRRLGRIASLIYVVVPVLMVALYVAYFASLIASIPISATPGNAPNIAGIGSLFTIAIIFLGIVSLAGLVIFIVAMHRLSHHYNEPVIFTNVLYGLILSIVGGVVVSVVVFVFFFSMIGNLIGQSTLNPAINPATFLTQLFISIAVVIVIALVFGIISGVLYMRAFNRLAASSAVDGFRTVGLLYLIGVIIPIIMWVAWILAYLNFGKLKPREPAPAYAYSAAPIPPVAGAVKHCPNCGADNSPDAIYCRNCGRPI